MGGAQARGTAVLTFDHRSFGESDGEPRGTVGWWRQLRGYKAAIDAIASKRLRRIKSASDHNNDGNNAATAPVGETLELSSAIDPRVSRRGASRSRLRWRSTSASSIHASAPSSPSRPATSSTTTTTTRRRRLRRMAKWRGSSGWRRFGRYKDMTADASERALGIGMAIPRPLPQLHSRSRRWLPADGSAERPHPRPWFGARIPDPVHDADAFFERRGGPASRWLNSARMAREGMADVGAACAHLLRVPTLVIAARDDRTSSFAGAAALVERLSAAERAPRSRLHEIASGGHFGIFDTPIDDYDEAEEVEEAVEAEEGEEGEEGQGYGATHPEEVRGAAEATARFLQTELSRKSIVDGKWRTALPPATAARCMHEPAAVLVLSVTKANPQPLCSVRTGPSARRPEVETMPRAISAEEALLTSTHEKLQRSKAFETGLVLAHVGGKADALRFAPTPEEDGVYTFKKVRSTQWMVQHAELVAHMLPGGIAVIGCYAFAPNAKLAKLEAALQPVLSFLAKRIQGVRPDSKQALLLLLPSDAKKVSAKTLSVGTDGAVASRLSPIELKLAKETPPLACFAADWAVDASLTLPSSSDSSAQAQAAALAEALVPSVEALEASIATIGGSLPSPAALVSSLGGGGGSVERPHRVALFATSPPPPAGAASGASASVRVTGVVHGRAFATSKDEVGGALEALKRDLASTLRFRLQKFFNDREEEEDDDEDGDEQGPLPTGEACAYALPRRAHFPLGSASSSAAAGAGAGAAIFSVCDHLEADDDATAVASRLSEYLGIGSDESSASALGKAGMLRAAPMRLRL